MRKFVAAAAFATGALALTPEDGFAQGAGCSALAGTTRTFTISTVFGTADFNAGDQINVRVTINSLASTPQTISAGSASGGFATQNAVVGSFFLSFIVQNSGSQLIDAALSGSGDVTATFLGCGDQNASSEAQAGQASRAILTDQSGLVFQRLNNLLTNKPQNRAGGPTQTAVNSVGNGGLALGQGAAGQGGDAGFGLWIDGAWTGLDDRDATLGSDGYSIAFTGGADTQLADGLTTGAAITFGVSRIESNATQDRRKETSIGFTPYIAYQIDDVFAVQGAVGYNYGGGRAEIGGIDGQIDAHRYFAAAEASAFQTFGDFALFSSVGVLWGQSFQQSYTDDAGAEVDSIKSDLGSLSVTAQPSYLIDLDSSGQSFIEPYLLGQYSYDFTLTKTSRSSNDRDEFVIGGGANFFHGEGVSGTLEASRTLGRDKNQKCSFIDELAGNLTVTPLLMENGDEEGHIW
ncbi:MAG: autotransporter outer membrane beta-barrel domain-containing protein, partial [Pseudomonadota bacterium]